MGGTGVIDRFLEVFTSYIDNGFGLLHGEVAFIATTLIVIDVTLAALFWTWGEGDDIVARLVKKTLFVGAFAHHRIEEDDGADLDRPAGRRDAGIQKRLIDNCPV